MRILALCSVLALSACAGPAADTASAALVERHAQIWQMMGLSPAAQKELNAVVAAVQGSLEKNRHAHPELFAREPKRAQAPTHDEYIAAHKRRFDALRISAATQQELLASAEFVWKALHDPNVPEKDRVVAMKIRDMMKMGPPPCCDDNIFEKAAGR